MRLPCICAALAVCLACGAASRGAVITLVDQSIDVVLEGDDPAASFRFDLPGDPLLPVVASFEGYYENLQPFETSVRHELSWTGPIDLGTSDGIHPDFVPLPASAQLPLNFEQRIDFTPAVLRLDFEGGGPSDQFRVFGNLTLRQVPEPSMFALVATAIVLRLLAGRAARARAA